MAIASQQQLIGSGMAAKAEQSWLAEAGTSGLSLIMRRRHRDAGEQRRGIRRIEQLILRHLILL